MPWKETTAMEQKIEFIAEWRSGQFAITELCRSFGISRTTAYKYINRFQEKGIEGLYELNRAPHVQPKKYYMKSNFKYFIFLIILVSCVCSSTQVFSHSWMAPVNETNKENPVDSTSESIKRGKQIYKNQCAYCHGNEATGLSKKETSRLKRSTTRASLGRA